MHRSLLLVVLSLSVLLSPLVAAAGVWYSFTTLDVPGAIETIGASINNLGQVAGTYRDSQGRYRGFLYEAGVFTLLDVPEASDTYSSPYPSAINDRGQNVGTYLVSPTRHGFLYEAGVFKPGQKVVYIRGELSRLVSNHLNSWKNLSTRVHPVEDLMF